MVKKLLSLTVVLLFSCHVRKPNKVYYQVKQLDSLNNKPVVPIDSLLKSGNWVPANSSLSYIY
jgi:hypothetical protein